MDLDFSRAALVYGSSRAAYFLNGQYYTADGKPISFEEAAQPDPKDLEAEAARQAATEALPSVTTIAAPPKAEEPVAIVDRPVERTTEVDAKWGEDRQLRLKTLSGHMLATMVMKAGGTPATGVGSKKKNISWLLENVKS
jgi:hypothetical protein